MAIENPPKHLKITPKITARWIEYYYSGRWINLIFKDGTKRKCFMVIGDNEFYDDEKECYFDAIVVNNDGDIFNCDETIRFDKIKEVELVEASSSDRE